MQKRMRGAHPRTPGGRAPAPKGSNSHPQAGSYTKYMPVQAPKAKKSLPKRDAE